MEPGALLMLGQLSTPEPYPSSCLTVFSTKELLARVGHAFLVRTVCVLSNEPCPLKLPLSGIFCHSDEEE